MTRELILSELKRDEGIRLVVYDDANGKPVTRGSLLVGHPTIGIGRALDVHGLSETEALYLLGNDVDAVFAALSASYPWFAGLDDARQRCLVNMAFNVGLSGLAHFPNMLKDAEAGQYESAAQEMESSAWYKQVGPRAVRLVALMRGV